jgi:hypothetical protein
MAKCLATTKYADHPWRMRFETWADKSCHAIGFDTGTKRDTTLCTCGWNGTPYWDGVNLAWAEWYRHVMAASVEANRSSVWE